MAKYNEKVAKIRESNNKPVGPYGRDSKERWEYNDQRNEEIKKMKLARLQFSYGKFLDKKVFTYRTFMSATGFSEHIAKDNLDALIDMGLIKSGIRQTSSFSKYFELATTKIPEGWPSKEELVSMELTYRNDKPSKPKEKVVLNEDQKASNNPLTRALKNKDYHPMNGIDSYEQFMKDTAKFYSAPELNEIVKAVHDLCRMRIEQQYIECPLCKGRIQRTNSLARCTKCGVVQDGGTFEQSMLMLRTLAKCGVKVV